MSRLSELSSQSDYRTIGIRLENTIDEVMADEPLHHVLYKLKSHGLHDLDKAQLMNRVDVKFLLPRAMLPWVIDQLVSDYSALEVNNKRVSNYANDYYDTVDMQFYQHHHNGKLNRYKVRQRHYVDTDTRFLEVKFKNNQKRTVKTRMLCDELAKYDPACHDFIEHNLNRPFHELNVNHRSGYKRIALANEANAERLTLDFDLWFQANDSELKTKLHGFFIAELKQEKTSKRSPFYRLMAKHNFAPQSFSKYCIGCASLFHEQIKTNQFKPTLRRIEEYSSRTLQMSPSSYQTPIFN